MTNSNLKRKVGTRKPRDRFLIVCEGEKTEPLYFEKFRVSKEIFGTGEDTIRIVQRAKMLQEEDEYDQVWCVFDKDDFTDEDFNAAIFSARNNGIKVAYSIEAFELWYVLHYEYHQSGTKRSVYKNKLSELLGEKYESNRTDMYDLLFDKQNIAIRNAKNLMKKYGFRNPAQNNPSTTVHKLVMELNKFSV